MQTLTSGSERNLDVVLRRVSLAVLVATMGLLGARAMLAPAEREMGAATLLGWLLCHLAAALWCEYDGRARGRRPLRTNLEGVFWFLPLGFAVYCLWSRGLRGLLPLLGIAFAAVTAMLLGAIATILLTVIFPS